MRVDYIPLPFFDEHFDLKDPNFMVGKTLIYGSIGIEGTIGLNCKILGLTLYQQWEKLNNMLNEICTSKNEIAQLVVS